MQSAYCQALTRSPSRPFFAAEMVRRNPYYQRAENAGKIGAWIATPGFLRNQIEALDAEYQAMGKEMFSEAQRLIAEKGVTAFKDTPQSRFMGDVWTPMLSRWNEFVADHTHWWDNFSGNVWDNIKLHRNTLIGLREKAEKAGFSFLTPQPLPPESTPWDSVSALLKIIVGALVGGLALYLATMLVKAIGQLKRPALSP